MPPSKKTTKSKSKNPLSEETKLKRFKAQHGGLTEKEVCKKGLPDYLKPNLDIVFIGINPSLSAAYHGRYYIGSGNHFWQILHLANLIPPHFGPHDDHKLLNYGMGFTNIVPRTTRGLSDLTTAEIKEGAKVLKAKLQEMKPKIAVFNGKKIYEVFSSEKKFMFGRQPLPLEGTHTYIWVMPSSSARCAQLPRAIDKVPFYLSLKKYLDYLHGRGEEPEEAEVVFANVVLKNFSKKPVIKTEPEDPHD